MVLGVIENPVARSLYSLSSEMNEGGQKFNQNLPKTRLDNPDEIRALQAQAHQFRNRIECTQNLFWEFAYSDFPKARDPGVSIGIRENWTVVIFKAAHRVSFFDLFVGGDVFG